MEMKRWLLFSIWAGLAACASHRAGMPQATAGGGEDASTPGARRYVDSDLGFEIVRPEGSWQLDAKGEPGSTEGVSIPVVLRHRETGAQVVVQIAPAVATPIQFAERLNLGLRSYPGFTASDPEPLSLSDDAVGFRFSMGDKVLGRIAVREGGKGNVFMMLATWPANASEGVTTGVDQIFGSLRPIPPG